MRIQHNIMAMGAYRNYTNNLSAMKKNLEKLSSGYKINRAGDDAAGLAISEKMRAQITGLETAQKNAKDGISLVQTAEGALTEVHDMLNRMVTLATQSANGTYDNETDRFQLQKEVAQLNSEINRIADSANFNGIKLLDGSMDSNSVKDPSTIINAKYKDVFAANLKSALGIPDAVTRGQIRGYGTVAGGNFNTVTLLETNSDGNARPSFEVSLDNLQYAISAGGTGDTFTISIGGTAVSATVGAGAVTGKQFGGKDLALCFTGKEISLDGVTYRAVADGDKIKFTATAITSNPINASYDIKFEGAGGAGVITGGVAGVFTQSGFTFATSSDGVSAGLSVNADITVNVNGQELKFSFSNVDAKKVATTASMIDQMKQMTATYTKDDGSSVELSLAEVLKVEAGANAGELKFTSYTKGDTDMTNDTVKLEDGEYVAELKEVKVSGSGVGANGISFTTTTVGVATAGADQVYRGVWNHDYSNGMTATINGGTVNVHTNGSGAGNDPARTSIDFTKISITDGLKLKLGNTEYTFAVGPDSKFTTADNVVDLTKLQKDDLENMTNLRKLAGAALTEAAKDNDIFSVGFDRSTSKLTLQQLISAKDSTDMTTMDGLLSYLGMSEVQGDVTVDKIEGFQGKPLTLQIGDTAESFNQLKVDIGDCHTEAIGVGDVDISTQEGAAAAIDKIKSAINYVSDVRGTLGATQNRLDHTINNLSVMTENIQDAESTIRDTDVAAEMMEYTKNNILIQSAQAMLAQANQVPQGVLQLLQ